jgi:hypothetical protein
MPVWIKNLGNAKAHNVYAYISTNSTYIIITDNYEEYPDIPAGERRSKDDFGFCVNKESLEEGDEEEGEGIVVLVRINLEIYSDEGSWKDHFFITIYLLPNPNLEYYDHEIDDDNSGESSGDGDG